MKCIEEVKKYESRLDRIKCAIESTACLLGPWYTFEIPYVATDCFRVEMSGKTLDFLRDEAGRKLEVEPTVTRVYGVTIVINDALPFGEFNILEVKS